jgi:hypothetical protein
LRGGSGHLLPDSTKEFNLLNPFVFAFEEVLDLSLMGCDIRLELHNLGSHVFLLQSFLDELSNEDLLFFF